MAIEIIIAVVEMAAKAYAEKQEADKNAAAIAKIIKDNNTVLIQSISDMINQAFSVNKLTMAQNQIDTLSNYMEEYQNNTQDMNKLEKIEEDCQSVIDILDDDDIKLSAIHSYITVAALRILAFRIKSYFEPNDLINAKLRAKDYADYLENLKPLIHAQFEARFSPVVVQFVQVGDASVKQCFNGNYAFDNQLSFPLDGEVWCSEENNGDLADYQIKIAKAKKTAADMATASRDAKRQSVWSPIQSDLIDIMDATISKFTVFSQS